ncbi:uncharacterized protein LOC130653791 [Hydractinia symbiolongicarpus]|uniref:uncharacterized protein LOC130653791 n=1 Tax=Hydractinia symbiolongicarpus TaxID=13093 RepID=UPI002551C4A9|nr:uncharacterized protein LOC130653791 [Hydractinia symbiolongicarpus]
MLKYVTEHFTDDIGVWQPRYGGTFIFSEKIPKGLIIDVRRRNLIDRESQKQRDTDIEIIKIAAEIIREEIRNMPFTYPIWPPTERSILSEIFEHFEHWLVQHGKNLNDYILTEEFQTCLKEVSFQSFQDVTGLEGLFELMEEYERDIKQAGKTALYWLSFMEMMDVLFGFIRGLKIGNWELHLDATRQMLPWFFAYDRPNYSRYCTFYVMEMLRLPETHPGICKEFT